MRISPEIAVGLRNSAAAGGTFLCRIFLTYPAGMLVKFCVGLSAPSAASVLATNCNFRVSVPLLRFELKALCLNPLTWILLAGVNLIAFFCELSNYFAWIGPIGSLNQTWEIRQHGFFVSYLLLGPVIFTILISTVSANYIFVKTKISNVLDSILTSPISAKEFLSTNIVTCAIFNMSALITHLLVASPLLNFVNTRYRGFGFLCGQLTSGDTREVIQSTLCIKYRAGELSIYSFDWQSLLSLYCGLGISLVLVIAISKIYFQFINKAIKFNGYLILFALLIAGLAGSKATQPIFNDPKLEIPALCITITIIIAWLFTGKNIDKEKIARP